MEACNGEFLYQYLNKCYKECPEGTEDKNIQFLCEDIIIEIKEPKQKNIDTSSVVAISIIIEITNIDIQIIHIYCSIIYYPLTQQTILFACHPILTFLLGLS